MREGDTAWRPRDHVAECNVNDVGEGFAPSPDPTTGDMSAARQREGDDTYRPRDAVSGALQQGLGHSETSDKDVRQADAVALEVGDEPSCVVPVFFVLSVIVLSALLVKFAFLLRDAWVLPIVARESALVGIFMCLVAIVYAVVALVRVFRKLPHIVQASKLDSAGKAISKRDQAKKLHKYLLTAFPESKKCFQDYEKLIGQGDGCSRKLQWLRNEIDDYEDWMDEFSIFEKMQDEAAKKCIIKRASLVFVKTGISPWKLVDAMAVLYHSVMMTTEIAKIYRRRISRFQAFRLAIDGLMAIGVASVAQDTLEKVAETLMSKVFEAGSELIRGIIGKATAKTAEGSLNAAFVYRLGCRMQLRFKPLVERDVSVQPRTGGFRASAIVMSLVVVLIVVFSLYFRYGDNKIKQTHNGSTSIMCGAPEVSKEAGQ